MAYSPVEQGRVLRRAVSPAQIALAWVIRQGGVIAIPRMVTPAHVRENRGAANLLLSAEDLAELDPAFSPPTRRRALEML